MTKILLALALSCMTGCAAHSGAATLAEHLAMMAAHGCDKGYTPTLVAPDVAATMSYAALERAERALWAARCDGRATAHECRCAELDAGGAY